MMVKVPRYHSHLPDSSPRRLMMMVMMQMLRLDLYLLDLDELDHIETRSARSTSERWAIDSVKFILRKK